MNQACLCETSLAGSLTGCTTDYATRHLFPIAPPHRSTPSRYNYGKASLSFSILLESLLAGPKRPSGLTECGMISELYVDVVHPSKVIIVTHVHP